MSVLDEKQSIKPQAQDGAIEPAVQQRMMNIRLLIGVVGIMSFVVAIGLVGVNVFQPAAQLLALAGLFVLTSATSLIDLLVLFPRRRVAAGLTLVSLSLALAVLGTSMLMANLGVPAAIVYLIFTLILSASTENDLQANLSIAAGIIVAGASTFFTDFSPFQQLSIGMVSIVTPAILGVLFMVYVTMLAMQFVTATLRIRLVTAFLAIVIIPMAIQSVIQSRFTFSVLNNEVSQGVDLAARQTASALDTLITDSQQSLAETARLEIFARYLEMPKAQRANSPEDQEMRMTLKVMDANKLSGSVYLSSYALLDEGGMNVYDTLRDRITSRLSPQIQKSMGEDLISVLPGEGSSEAGQAYFQIPFQSGKTYISPVEVSSSTRGFFYISAPVKDKNDRVLGVLRARYDALLLQDLIKQYNGLLTQRSYAMLVDENNIRLADGFSPNSIYKTIAPLPSNIVQSLQANRRLPNLPGNMVTTNLVEFSQILNDYQKSPFFTTRWSLVYGDDKHSEVGAIISMRTMPWRVAYLRADYNVEDLRREQRRLTTLVTTLVAGLVGLVAVGAAQLLSNPIIRLTKTAQSISSGNLDAQATEQSADEFGTLASAFNLMTGQLRGLINQLEDRVKARTQEIENQNMALANRARQLQTVSDVARQIVSSQELESLLSSITHLVSERFGFYHVGIFLLDEKREHAVLRAANSEGGHRMLARQHMLPVGRVGIVGYTTGTGEARIATDVGADAVFFNNPDLPETRSEMALPLMINDQVIGALDIQSTESNAFHEDDIELFNTLADQVAIAIHNNQLFLDTVHALDEAQKLHRQYLRGEWAEDVSRRKVRGYLFNQAGITNIQAENPLWKKVFNSGEPVYAVLPSSAGSPDKAVMAIPISVRGETIGVIHVQDQGNDRIWSEDEVSVVNSIANQVAVALENARLFENTVRRAEREKKVLQITAKIRSTNDPKEMMQIAVSELQEALRATRTQIYIRQNESNSDDNHAGSSNGHNRKPSSDL